MNDREVAIPASDFRRDLKTGSVDAGVPQVV